MDWFLELPASAIDQFFGPLAATWGLMVFLIISLSLAFTFLLAWGVQYSLEFWASYRRRKPVKVNYWLAFLMTVLLGFIPYVDGIILVLVIGTLFAGIFTDNPYRQMAATDDPSQTPTVDPAETDSVGMNAEPDGAEAEPAATAADDGTQKV